MDVIYKVCIGAATVNELFVILHFCFWWLLVDLAGSSTYLLFVWVCVFVSVCHYHFIQDRILNAHASYVEYMFMYITHICIQIFGLYAKFGHPISFWHIFDSNMWCSWLGFGIYMHKCWVSMPLWYLDLWDILGMWQQHWCFRYIYSGFYTWLMPVNSYVTYICAFTPHVCQRCGIYAQFGWNICLW